MSTAGTPLGCWQAKNNPLTRNQTGRGQVARRQGQPLKVRAKLMDTLSPDPGAPGTSPAEG